MYRISSIRTCFVGSQLLTLRFKSSAARPFTITYTTPNRTVPITETYASLRFFRNCFRGWAFRHPKTGIITTARGLDYETEPGIVWATRHPLLGTWHNQISSNQISSSDKAFEEKAGKALERHLLLHANAQRYMASDPKRQDGWRFLTAETGTDVLVVAEWEGIWKGADGHVYFLEAKHFIDGCELVTIDTKYQRSLDFLNIDRDMATVYIAGKYWGGQEQMDYACRQGFGVIQENGSVLEIKEPNQESLIEAGEGEAED